jgi:hypothetical protein
MVGTLDAIANVSHAQDLEAGWVKRKPLAQ